MKPNLSKKPVLEPEFFSPQVAKARRFYLNLQPPPGTRLAVVCGGLEHCREDYVIRRDSFPYYSIEYVARGRGELRLKNRKYILQPGCIFSYGPGIPHEITSDPANPLVKYFVDFAGAGTPLLFRTAGLALGRISSVFPANVLVPLFDELIESGRQGGRQNEELCLRLLECVALKAAAAKVPIDAVESPASFSFQRCLNHIEKHFLRLRSLEQIAEECHTDNAYLCRLFHRYHQQSPYQFLLRLKMNHAAGRLAQRDVLVKQVAVETGFADPLHFSRVFKKMLGLSPEAFRQNR